MRLNVHLPAKCLWQFRACPPTPNPPQWNGGGALDRQFHVWRVVPAGVAVTDLQFGRRHHGRDDHFRHAGATTVAAHDVLSARLRSGLLLPCMAGVAAPPAGAPRQTWSAHATPPWSSLLPTAPAQARRARGTASSRPRGLSPWRVLARRRLPPSPGPLMRYPPAQTRTTVCARACLQWGPPPPRPCFRRHCPGLRISSWSAPAARKRRWRPVSSLDGAVLRPPPPSTTSFGGPARCSRHHRPRPPSRLRQRPRRRPPQLR